MSTLSIRAADHKQDFELVAAPFLQGPGLPFEQALDASVIAEAFRAEDALFGQDDLFSTPVVLWAFLAQVLQDGKEGACSAAVNRIAIHLLLTGRTPPSGDTGDYCRARAKLSVAALRRLVRGSARQLEAGCRSNWLWKGCHAKLVDGFTFTMPDTPDNRAAFPQNPSQVEGVGLPIARACAVVSLATGCVFDLAAGPYVGKETGEGALLRSMLEHFEPGEVAVFDRYFCSYWLVAMLAQRGVQVCARLHGGRITDFRQGRRLGQDDHLITWLRPKCPPWMAEDEYAQIPETLTLRELRYEVPSAHCRIRSITLITTMTNPNAHPRDDLAELYGQRWHVELDIRAIKHPLRLDHLRCKTPEMIDREVWVTLLAYNLVRKVMATAAATHRKQPRQLSFTLTCQSILACWMTWASGQVTDAAALGRDMLARAASHEVGDRPGRIEPRVLKRRRHRYPLMQQPRAALRAAMGKT